MDREAVLNRLQSVISAKKSAGAAGDLGQSQSQNRTTEHAPSSGGLGRRYERGDSNLTRIKEARMAARAVKWQDKLRYPVDKTLSEIECDIEERGEPLLEEQIARAAFELMGDYDTRNKTIGMRAAMEMIRVVQSDDHAKDGRGNTTEVNVNVDNRNVVHVLRVKDDGRGPGSA